MLFCKRMELMGYWEFTLTLESEKETLKCSQSLSDPPWPTRCDAFQINAHHQEPQFWVSGVSSLMLSILLCHNCRRCAMNLPICGHQNYPRWPLRTSPVSQSWGLWNTIQRDTVGLRNIFLNCNVKREGERVTPVCLKQRPGH